MIDGLPVPLIQSLSNGFSLLRLREPRERFACEDFSILVWVAFALIFAQGALSFLVNGRPGHIEWLALPDLTFPIVLMAFSSWAILVMVNEKSKLFDLLSDLLSARLLIVLLEVAVQTFQHSAPARIDWVGGDWSGLADSVQAMAELWWLLAVMVKLGRIPSSGKSQTQSESLLVWGAFLGPWLFWLSVFQPADLWQADGVDSDPKHYMLTMTEDTFTSEPMMFDGLLDSFEPEQPGVEDIYFLGLAGEAGNPMHLREAELANTVLHDVYGVDGRAGILANNASSGARYAFATHHNFESILNRIGELIDVEDDVLFLFLSSRGTQSSSLVLSQPGLSLADLDPKGIKLALDDAQIKWRIIVISACYSGGFINELSNPQTVLITSSDKTDAGLGCTEKTGTTWFTQSFFEDHLKKSLGITAAFKATLEALQKEQGPTKKSGLPQMVMGAEMKKKLASFEANILQPGALKDGLRAQRHPPFAVNHQAGMSGVKEHSKAWMASLKRSLRFFKRIKANSSISPAS